ncbi:globin [Sandarakinorhabdus glacialis]|nr:globin [Polymorphobacter glacialis]
MPDPAAIESSLTLAADRAGDPTPLVYARLFAQHPEMAELFCQDRSNAVKGEMLTRVFEAILDFIGPRNYADHLIRSEGAAHDAYGVPPAVFTTFFKVIADTLSDTLSDILGPDWTHEFETAWQSLLLDLEALTPSVTPAKAGAHLPPSENQAQSSR